MSKRTEIAEILKSEYGIGSVAELEQAIDQLGPVDISLFFASCSFVPSLSENATQKLNFP